MSSLDFELRLWIASYLSGQVSLADFRRWLLPAAWLAGEPGGADSILVRLAELRMAEFMNGHWTEPDLRTMLATIAPRTTGLAVAMRIAGATADEVVRPVRAPTSLQGELATA